jgi:hypothetical protein
MGQRVPGPARRPLAKQDPSLTHRPDPAAARGANEVKPFACMTKTEQDLIQRPLWPVTFPGKEPRELLEGDGHAGLSFEQGFHLSGHRVEGAG